MKIPQVLKTRNLAQSKYKRLRETHLDANASESFTLKRKHMLAGKLNYVDCDNVC